MYAHLCWYMLIYVNFLFSGRVAPGLANRACDCDGRLCEDLWPVRGCPQSPVLLPVAVREDQRCHVCTWHRRPQTSHPHVIIRLHIHTAGRCGSGRWCSVWEFLNWINGLYGHDSVNFLAAQSEVCFISYIVRSSDLACCGACFI